MAQRIDFNNPINCEAQIGDSVLVASIDPNTGVTTFSPLLIGVLIEKGVSHIIVEENFNFAVNPGDFIMFSKPISVNKSSVQGYYADITLKNISNTYAELFAISSEVVPSSK